MIREGK